MSTYDVPDDNISVGGAFVAPGSFPVVSAQQPFAFCRTSGGDIFMAVENSNQLEIWRYSSGVRTVYTIGALVTAGEGTTVSGISSTADGGNRAILLRTDGTTVWLVYWLATTASFTGAASAHVQKPVIQVWNGAGFTSLGSLTVSTANRERGGSFQFMVGHESALTATASPAETGVLHVAWSECGVYSITNPGVSVDVDGAEVLHYGKCSSAAIVTDIELAHANTRVVSAGVPYGGSFPTPIHTDLLWLTNGSGDPILFYGKPSSHNTFQFGTITYSTDIDMVDINASGSLSMSVLRTIDVAVLDATVTNLSRAGFGGSRYSTLIGGIEYAYLAVSVLVSGVLAVRLIVGKADGSTAFTYPDTDTVEGTGVFVGQVIDDVYDDTDNIWANRFSGNIRQYHRACPAWEGWAARPAADIFAIRDLEYPAGDTLYGIGRDASDHTKFGPVALPILRDYATCTGGLRSWQRF